MADAGRVEPAGRTRQGVGATFTCVTRVGPLRNHDVLVVTGWDPGRRLTIEHPGRVRGVGRFELAGAGTGTASCWDEPLHCSWWRGGGAGERLARAVLRRVGREKLARRRRRVEAG